MTKINKLVMTGFKSFAKRTELLYGNKFNCVLGPNGAGKSNILDALCFVLGKTSAKTLRAEKSSNLIYNGGKTKKPSNSAEVSIYFDNKSKVFPTDDEEVKVTRVVRQNGQSKYKINDQMRTRQQVIDLLSIAKIDPDGYNIILQGDIVRFTEMPAIERRMLIEDISGIGVYEEKKQKALNELEKVGQKLNEADIVLTERKTYLRELKKDRDQALKYKEMNDRINQNKASYLKIQIDKKEKEKEDYGKRIRELKEKLEKINSEISKLKNENEEKRSLIENITNDIEEKGEVEQIKLSKEIEGIKISLTKDLARVETCKGEINKIKNRKEELNKEIEETNKKIGELNDQVNDLKLRRVRTEKERAGLRKTIENFREKNKLDEALDVDKNMEEIDKKIEEQQKQVQGLREQEHDLLREKDRLEIQISSFDEKINKVLQIEKEHKKQIDELKAKREKFKESTLELNKRLDEDTSLAGQIANAREKLVKSNGELAKLETKKATIKERVFADIAVKKILEQKKKTKGIYGTVSDLGDVEEKYSLALEVAAGPRLKSIIVEDDKVAEECIKYLKKNKLGIATFFPLSKIKAKPMLSGTIELAKKEGCHGLAINLVKFDKKFEKVFNHIFANTLVVDNISAARKIGIGKIKMVTLDGDLTEVSGVMHGGYRKAKLAGFKDVGLDNDIKEYKDIVKQLNNTTGVLEKRRKENEDKINELRNLKGALEGEIIKTEKSLHLEPGEIDISKQKKKELQLELESINKKLEDVKANVEEINKKLTGDKTKKQGLREKITQLRSPTVLAELNTFEEKQKQVSETIMNINSEINTITTQINNIYTPEIEKTKQILLQHDKELEEFNEEIKELNSVTETKQEELKTKEEKETEFRSRYKSLFTKRSILSGEIQKNELEVSKKQEISKDFEIKNNTVSLKNAEVLAQLSALNQEFEQYHGVKIFTDKPEEELKREISKFEKMREEIGSVNMRALEIYDDVEKEYNGLLGKKEKLENEKKDVLKLMGEIEGKKKSAFMETLEAVNENFKGIFTSLSKKGDAYLVLENKENPFEAGLRINVKITSNKFLDIRSLSGGEKTLTALAFIFAIQEHDPASFYILDEVDAALDKRNSETFAKLIRGYAEKAQYLIISHNDAVVSEADNLYGISMDEVGVSKAISLKI